jgi:hypothetical protein
MSEREELMDDLDCAVFSGDLLFTDFDAFKEYVARWQRAIDEHTPVCECEEECDSCACKQVEPEPKYRFCTTCHSRVPLVDNYSKGWHTISNFIEPCNTCTHNNVALDEPPCYDCTHNQDN